MSWDTQESTDHTLRTACHFRKNKDCDEYEEQKKSGHLFYAKCHIFLKKEWYCTYIQDTYNQVVLEKQTQRDNFKMIYDKCFHIIERYW